VLTQPGKSSRQPPAFAPDSGSLQRQDSPELAQQTPDAVDGGRALLDEALAHPVNAERALLGQVLDGHKTHVGPLHGLANGGGFRRVVLTLLARESIGRDELERHQPGRGP